MIEVIPYGEAAVLINFEQKIDLEINQKVTRLQELIELELADKITFRIPAYCSLTIGFDWKKIKFEDISQKIKKLSSDINQTVIKEIERKFSIPICYENEFALDKEAVESQTGLSFDEIIQLHTNQVFTVFMLGFLPGFAYLGKLPEKLKCKRKETPRKLVPKNSVGLAGFQTGIYPSDSPGGWQIIGKTPISFFNTKKENPFILQAGDQVQFYAISKSEFSKIEKEVKSNNFILKNLNE